MTGVAGGRSNQVEGAGFSEIKEIILLRAAEAVDLVDEHQDILGLSFLRHSLDVRDVAAGRAQGAELLLHLLTDGPGNRSLPNS